jgi:hypothetical protein
MLLVGKIARYPHEWAIRFVNRTPSGVASLRFIRCPHMLQESRLGCADVLICLLSLNKRRAIRPAAIPRMKELNRVILPEANFADLV